MTADRIPKVVKRLSLYVCVITQWFPYWRSLTNANLINAEIWIIHDKSNNNHCEIYTVLTMLHSAQNKLGVLIWDLGSLSIPMHPVCTPMWNRYVLYLINSFFSWPDENMLGDLSINRKLRNIMRDSFNCWFFFLLLL